MYVPSSFSRCTHAGLVVDRFVVSAVAPIELSPTPSTPDPPKPESQPPAAAPRKSKQPKGPPPPILQPAPTQLPKVVLKTLSRARANSARGSLPPSIEAPTHGILSQKTIKKATQIQPAAKPPNPAVPPEEAMYQTPEPTQVTSPEAALPPSQAPTSNQVQAAVEKAQSGKIGSGKVPTGFLSGVGGKEAQSPPQLPESKPPQNPVCPSFLFSPVELSPF
jgi:hypothetical protein